MKVSSVTGVSDSYGNATLVAMSGAIRSALTSYRNVTFVERYYIPNISPDESRCRDVYAIGGINNLYLTIENEADYNTSIVVRVYLKNNVHTDNYIVTLTLKLDGEELGEKTYLFDNKMYTFSDNGRLYCLMFSTKNSKPTDYIGIDSGYIYINDSACKDDSYGTKQYVNAYIPNITYSETEKALKTRPLITADNIASATAFYSISGILYKMINSAFSAMNFSLIQIGDTKYRQVYANYLFVKNGDNE